MADALAPHQAHFFTPAGTNNEVTTTVMGVQPDLPDSRCIAERAENYLP
jgi:hypothetical protein